MRCAGGVCRIDSNRLARVAGVTQETQHPLAAHAGMQLDDNTRPPSPESVAHALQHLQFHALDVDLDAVNRVVAAVHERPHPIEPGEGRINVCASGICTRRVGHPPRQRQPAHFECVRRSEPHRYDRELIESIQQPALIDASRGHRDRLEREILSRIPDSHVNGRTGLRLPNTTNIGFARLEAEAILLLLSEQNICASAGAACSSGSLEPSHVLRAMKIDPKIAHGAIRLSLSRYTTDADIDRALEILPNVIARLRAVMPVAT